MDRYDQAAETLKCLLKAKDSDEIDNILAAMEPDICKEVIKMLATTFTGLVFVKFLEY